mgnify:CR=1 FL=1
MKNLSRILWGIVLIFIGVIWGLNRTGVADINIFFDGWWTLFIIVPSAISFFEKGNNKISYKEAEELMDELMKADNPYNCPHGRPTIIYYSAYELEKLFKRVV